MCPTLFSSIISVRNRVSSTPNKKLNNFVNIMKKSESLVILVAVLLANLLLAPEAIAGCRGFKVAPGFILAKKYKLKLILDGGVIVDYILRIKYRTFGGFVADIKQSFQPRESIVIKPVGNFGDLSFDVPFRVYDSDHNPMIQNYKCNAGFDYAACSSSIGGTCTYNRFVPEINQTVPLQATVTADPVK